jgi:hypothetical protein
LSPKEKGSEYVEIDVPSTSKAEKKADKLNPYPKMDKKNIFEEPVVIREALTLLYTEFVREGEGDNLRDVFGKL